MLWQEGLVIIPKILSLFVCGFLFSLVFFSLAMSSMLVLFTFLVVLLAVLCCSFLVATIKYLTQWAELKHFSLYTSFSLWYFSRSHSVLFLSIPSFT